MNCDQFANMVGMRCDQVGDAIEVITPFTFSDGDGIELFAQSLGPQVLFFDDGFTLHHLHSVGIDVGFSQKRWQPLKSIAKNYGVTLSDSGVFETLCSASNPSEGFARMVSTLLGVASWEREHAGVSLDSAWLVDEVALYLKAWKPSSPLIEKPIAQGFSGRMLTFDFEIDGKFVDAVQPHSASTGAELRKLVDLSSNKTYFKKEVLVVVDDRVNPLRAKQEIEIIGRVASAWPMSSLIKASGASHVTQ
jgi:hypothetical protein